ncbi:hypothetical protein MTP10_31500 [Nonomuraea sp. 3-1Str]|uniref:hypothetical protein n=1 Tax=Nonomuraea sp. 3-1Str TaxID=2929801 RepID=UPI002854F30E|nr:hypothetical protein [Nonomuraea sp. 3-1Str]MDR8413244.1 hypothetical protein [Nonomuraea sp. 3-1Str]
MPLIAAAAATDPEIAAQWPDGPGPRYTVQYAAAEALAGKPDARPGLSVEMAADLLFGLLSPQLYLIFVRDRDWSPDTWEEWARTALTSQLCADPGRAGGRHGRPPARNTGDQPPGRPPAGRVGQPGRHPYRALRRVRDPQLLHQIVDHLAWHPVERIRQNQPM